MSLFPRQVWPRSWQVCAGSVLSRITPDRRARIVGKGAFATPCRRGSLGHDIALALFVKMAALILLYVVCFAPSHRVAVTPDHVASLLLGAASGVARP